MFVKETVLKRMMKEAFKGVGLRIINKEKSYVLTGRKWFLEIFKVHMPKEILGQIFALAGMLPDEESQFLANPDGNQEELYLTPSSDVDVYMNALRMQAEEAMVRPTDVLVDQGWAIFRLYKDACGEVYPVPESIHAMISKSLCDSDEEYHGSFVDGDGMVFWISTSGAFAITSYEDNLATVEAYQQVKELFRESEDDESDISEDEE